jgi:hypothetical protein
VAAGEVGNGEECFHRRQQRGALLKKGNRKAPTQPEPSRGGESGELALELPDDGSLLLNDLETMLKEVQLKWVGLMPIEDPVVDVIHVLVEGFDLEIDTATEDPAIAGQDDVSPGIEPELPKKAGNLTLGHRSTRWCSGEKERTTEQRAKCTAAELHEKSPHSAIAKQGHVISSDRSVPSRP